MRNITQWRRETDLDILRVYQFRGKTKTAESFLVGAPYTRTVVKYNGEFILSPSRNFIPAENIQEYKIRLGGYIVRTKIGGVLTFKDSDELFKHMFGNGYRYMGAERVRNENITEEKDPTGILALWDNWSDGLDKPKEGPKKYKPRDNEAASSAKCTTAPLGWECTQQKGHSGPCAAKEVQIATKPEPEFVKVDVVVVGEEKKPSLLDRFLSFIGYK